MGQKIDPFYNRTKYKNPFAYNNARQRYALAETNHARGCAPTFQNYNLATMGLATIGTSGTNKGIDRVLYSKQNAPYLIGVELEVEGCEGRQNDNQCNAVARVLAKYLPENHVCVPDGSLRNGFEIVTAPLTPTEVNRVGWYGLLRELSRAGLTSHESGRCGLHVNISRKYLTDQYWRRLRGFITRQRAFFNEISRRNGDNYYCQYSNETSKYTALNLSKTSVCEFRFFRGTLKPSSFIASIETVRALVEWVRGLQETNKTRLTVSGFLKTLNQSRFKVARDYIGARVELLKTPTPTTRRPRRTNDERRRDAVRRFASYRNPVGSYLNTNDNLGLCLSIEQRAVFADNLSIEYTPETRAVEYQIDWQNSYLTRLMRDAVARGWLPATVVVTSRFHSDPQTTRVRFTHYQGGWGHNSRIASRFVRVAPSSSSSSVG